MALESLPPSELLNYIIFESLSAPQCVCNEFSPENKILLGSNNIIVPKRKSQELIHDALNSSCAMLVEDNKILIEDVVKKENKLGVQGGRKKRKRRPKVCKNKEEAENQRMTHITVERNRRKQMNEYLAVLSSLMPQSYVQRGDQASIVGGAIEFAKRLEHTLQSLESQKLQSTKQHLHQLTPSATGVDTTATVTTRITTANTSTTSPTPKTTIPETTPVSQSPQKLFTSKSKGSIADIEVTLIETHANVRILSQRRLIQISKLVAAFQALYMTILHLNVTTLDPLVLYSISAKVEDGCQFSSANDIASAINHVLRIIEDEATLLC